MPLVVPFGGWSRVLWRSSSRRTLNKTVSVRIIHTSWNRLRWSFAPCCHRRQPIRHSAQCGRNWWQCWEDWNACHVPVPSSHSCDSRTHNLPCTACLTKKESAKWSPKQRVANRATFVLHWHPRGFGTSGQVAETKRTFARIPG